MATTLNSLLLTGSVVQTVYSEIQVGNSITSTVDMPTSGTITQSHGTEIMTVSITPKSATNKLLVLASVDVAIGGTTGIVAMMFLYRDSGNAVAYGNFYTNSYLYGTIPIIYRCDAGSTASTTFKLRGGPHSSSVSTTFGGALNGPSYPGGTSNIGGSITVMEISV